MRPSGLRQHLRCGCAAWVIRYCGAWSPFPLNYVPILGPMIGVAMFTLAGLLTAKTLWLALLPAGLYFVIHLAEGDNYYGLRCWHASLHAQPLGRHPGASSSGIGCGACLARSWRCPCSQSRKLFATGSGCWRPSGTFLRVSYSQLVASQRATGECKLASRCIIRDPTAV